MVLLNGLRKYAATIFLVIFYASASFAAANGLALQPDTDAQTMHRGNDPAGQTSGGLTSEYFTEYLNNDRVMITAPEHPDMPVGSMNESAEKTASIILRKDGDTIIWSLAPSLRSFSLKPMDNINNLQLVLKYRF